MTEPQKVEAVTGSIIATSIKEGVLEGLLRCDGSEVCREKYKDLFEIIGVSYGEGDGIKTFNLPDYRGRPQSHYFVKI